MATKTAEQPAYKRARFTNVNAVRDHESQAITGYNAVAYKDGKIVDEEPFATEGEAVEFCNKSMNYA